MRKDCRKNIHKIKIKFDMTEKLCDLSDTNK